MTCARAQEFLLRNKVKAGQSVDARKTAMQRKEALTLATRVDEVYVSKGSKVVHVDLKKEKPSADDLAELLLGPTGNLRAPTIIAGKTLIVGFDEGTYKKVLATG